MAELFDLKAWTKAEIQKLKQQLENLKYVVELDGSRPPLPDPGPERFLQIDFSSEVLITEMYEQLISSGDPDGSPAVTLVRFKTGLAEIYIAEAERLRSEVSRIQKRKTLKEYA